MRTSTSRRSLLLFAAVCLALIFLITGCLPKPTAESGDVTITLYGFSIMKESLEKGIYSGFAEGWKQKHGQAIEFQSSFAGSETVTNQILRGAPAEIAILSIA